MNTLTLDVEAAMHGSEDAFSRVVAQSANAVRAIALAIVRDVSASEDVAQETFLAAWSGIGKLRNPDSFLPWLRQIARNQAHLCLRRRQEHSDDVALQLAADARPRVDEALIDDEQRRIVAEVIDELPDETRETLILFYLEGSSTRQVAELLGISEDAVRQRLSRARVKVREESLRRFGIAIVKLVSPKLALGALGGVAGVLMSGTHLDPPFDEQEEAERRRFTIHAVLITIAAAIAFAAVGHDRWLRLAALFIFVTIMAHQYFVRLPRIMARRLEWERQVNPEIAKQRRWRQIYAAVGQAGAAAISGITLMTLLHC